MPDTPRSAASKFRLWRAPVVVLVAWPAGMLAILGLPLEAAYRVIYGLVLCMAAAVTLLIWFAVRAPVPPRVKTAVWVLLACGVVLVSVLFKIDGYRGNLLPIIRFRYSPPPPEIEVVGAEVDLGTPGEFDRPRFLGEEMRPVVRGVRLADDWDRRPPELLWSRPIGEGFSSFAVVGEYAVTQQQSMDKRQELVVCYHWPSGEVRWRHGDPVYFQSSLGGRGPRATPTIHQGRVYSLGATGILNCLDGADGRLIWSHDLVRDHGAVIPEYGLSGSPLAVDDLVVVSGGGAPDRSLLAFDAAGGELRWSAGSEPTGYASPLTATLDGVRQIVVLNAQSVSGHDPSDGNILWTLPRPGNSPNVAQPIVLPGDRLLLTKEYGTGSILFQLSRDESGRWSGEELWRDHRLLKTKFTNAVIHDGYAYGISDVLLQCIDPFQGEQQWVMRGDFGNGHVLLVGDLLLVQTEHGAIELYPAQPTRPERLARFQALHGRTWNYPVLVGEHLLVRNDTEAALYRLPTVEESE